MIVTLEVVYDHVGKCRKLALCYFTQINLIFFCLTTQRGRAKLTIANIKRGSYCSKTQKYVQLSILSVKYTIEFPKIS